jgi:hypothetical protein
MKMFNALAQNAPYVLYGFLHLSHHDDATGHWTPQQGAILAFPQMTSNPGKEV